LVSVPLPEIADLLQIKNDNPFKIRAYRNGAEIVSNHPHDFSALDAAALREIPGIGNHASDRTPPGWRFSAATGR